MGGFLPVHEEAYGFQIGCAISRREGSDATIVATGTMVRQAIEAHNRPKERGVQAGVLDMHTIKPLDAAAIREAAQRTGRIVTAEMHGLTAEGIERAVFSLLEGGKS